jgi:hypothetical protein
MLIQTLKDIYDAVVHAIQPNLDNLCRFSVSNFMKKNHQMVNSLEKSLIAQKNPTDRE